jgi:AraC-like DNA-binding protein
MQYKIIKPSRVLKPYIRNYWVLDSDNINQAGNKQRIFPHGCMELNIYYRDKFIQINNQSKTTLTNSTITGQGNSFKDLVPTGKVGIFSVIFEPLGAAMFFRIPLDKLGHDSIPLETITGRDASDLEEQIAEAGSIENMANIMENFLHKRLIENKLHYHIRLSESIKKINDKFGNENLKELSGITCLSPKQFERNFSSFTGTKPKQFMRIIRFQAALYKKQIDPQINLTNLAYDCGYYDQAHFTKEFKSFTGIAPKTYFSENTSFSDYFSL